MPVYESDVCIIGAGITSAMVAEKLAELRPGLSIRVVEAGRRIFDLNRRFALRKRSQEYGENPWPNDFIPDQIADGQISHTMAVGGQALHWGGTCNRFSAEDLELKTRYDLYEDWALKWSELEPFYCEAERRLGVSGSYSLYPDDKQSQPYPMEPMPLSWNLIQYKEWGKKSGLDFQGVPQAKNTRPYGGRAQCQRCGTCAICPTGAKYSPDFTFQQLLAARRITLDDRTLIRQLVLDSSRDTILAARGSRYGTGEQVEYHAPIFVLANGYTWSSHLLLLSRSSRYPNGLANRTGQVGRYMNGHEFTTAMVEMDAAIYPGMNPDYGLVCRKFFRCKPGGLYVRHDLRIFEAERDQARLKNEHGQLMFGDEVAADWRSRHVVNGRTRGTARVRAYCDVHPAQNSELTLDPARKNEWGDPLPKIVHRFDAATLARDAATQQHLAQLFSQLARENNGKVLASSRGNYLDHPAGGCRMGNDPASSVCDSYGRTHNHENLFVVGAPTLPTAGCTNGTLTFSAVSLRSAGEIAKAFPARA
ncbi:MAG: GMC oxidoreductase [Terriglobales bacterium]